MTYRYEWQHCYEQEIHDIHNGPCCDPQSAYDLSSEANAYAVMGHITKALCLYEDFLAAARTSKLAKYVPVVERQIALMYKYKTAQQRNNRDRQELLIHLEQLEQEASRGAFNAVRQAMGFPQIAG